MILNYCSATLRNKLTSLSRCFLLSQQAPSFIKIIPQPLILSIFLILLLFIWQGNKGFSLWDEGFLWYGVQRVMVGEVPIRDFMAYDPGRYYWSSIIMRLLDDNGIMALRSTTAIIQTMGLFVALLLIRSIKNQQNFLFLFLSAIILSAWMFPRHKLFDISLSIFLIGAISYLIENPTKRNYFFLGLCVGFISVFGRNHGIYGSIGSFGVFVWLNIGKIKGQELFKISTLCICGVIIGYSPILFMLWLEPDFAKAFLDSILFLFDVKSTNLPLPVPWPWRTDFTLQSQSEIIRSILVGLFFVALLVLGILSICWIIWKKLGGEQVPSALVAASFMILPYASHLAQGVFPLLIFTLISLAAQSTFVKWPLIFILCGASIWVTHTEHPGWQYLKSNQWVTVEVSGNSLMVDQGTANDIGLLRQLTDQYLLNGESFLVTPFWPGAYALFEKKSPVWEIYALFPRQQAFQQAELNRIKKAKPAFVFIFNMPLDGQNNLLFQNTHPLIYHYVIDNFERLPNTHNPAYQIFIPPPNKT